MGSVYVILCSSGVCVRRRCVGGVCVILCSSGVCVRRRCVW